MRNKISLWLWNLRAALEYRLLGEERAVDLYCQRYEEWHEKQEWKTTPEGYLYHE